MTYYTADEQKRLRRRDPGLTLYTATDDPNAGAVDPESLSWGTRAAVMSSNNFEAGIDALQGVVQKATGFDDAANANFAEYNRLSGLARRFGPEIQSWDDVEQRGVTAGNVGQYLGAQVANMVPDVGLALGGAAVGTLVAPGVGTVGGLFGGAGVRKVAMEAGEAAAESFAKREAARLAAAGVADDVAMQSARAGAADEAKRVAAQTFANDAATKALTGQIQRATTFTGATAAGVPSALNDDRTVQLAQEGDAGDAWTLLGGGVAQAMLDTIPILRAVDKVGGQVTGEAIKATTDRFLKRAMKETAVQGGLEGLTEVGQEAFKNASHAIVTENPELLYEPDALKNYLVSFATGAVLGGALGGGVEAGGAAGRQVQRTTRQVWEATNNYFRDKIRGPVQQDPGVAQNQAQADETVAATRTPRDPSILQRMRERMGFGSDNARRSAEIEAEAEAATRSFNEWRRSSKDFPLSGDIQRLSGREGEINLTMLTMVDGLPTFANVVARRNGREQTADFLARTGSALYRSFTAPQTLSEADQQLVAAVEPYITPARRTVMQSLASDWAARQAKVDADRAEREAAEIPDAAPMDGADQTVQEQTDAEYDGEAPTEAPAFNAAVDTEVDPVNRYVGSRDEADRTAALEYLEGPLSNNGKFRTNTFERERNEAQYERKKGVNGVLPMADGRLWDATGHALRLLATNRKEYAERSDVKPAKAALLDALSQAQAAGMPVDFGALKAGGFRIGSETVRLTQAELDATRADATQRRVQSREAAAPQPQDLLPPTFEGDPNRESTDPPLGDADYRLGPRAAPAGAEARAVRPVSGKLPPAVRDADGNIVRHGWEPDPEINGYRHTETGEPLTTIEQVENRMLDSEGVVPDMAPIRGVTFGAAAESNGVSPEDAELGRIGAAVGADAMNGRPRILGIRSRYIEGADPGTTRAIVTFYKNGQRTEQELDVFNDMVGYDYKTPNLVARGRAASRAEERAQSDAVGVSYAPQAQDEVQYDPSLESADGAATLSRLEAVAERLGLPESLLYAARAASALARKLFDRRAKPWKSDAKKARLLQLYAATLAQAADIAGPESAYGRAYDAFDPLPRGTQPTNPSDIAWYRRIMGPLNPDMPRNKMTQRMEADVAQSETTRRYSADPGAESVASARDLVATAEEQAMDAALAEAKRRFGPNASFNDQRVANDAALNALYERALAEYPGYTGAKAAIDAADAAAAAANTAAREQAYAAHREAEAQARRRGEPPRQFRDERKQFEKINDQVRREAFAMTREQLLVAIKRMQYRYDKTPARDPSNGGVDPRSFIAMDLDAMRAIYAERFGPTSVAQGPSPQAEFGSYTQPVARTPGRAAADRRLSADPEAARREADAEAAQTTADQTAEQRTREGAYAEALMRSMGFPPAKVTVESHTASNGEVRAFEGGMKVDKDGNITITLGDALSGAERMEVLQHEIGHAVLLQHIAKTAEIPLSALIGPNGEMPSLKGSIEALAEADPKLHAALKADYDQWLAKNTNKAKGVNTMLGSRGGLARAAGRLARGGTGTRLRNMDQAEAEALVSMEEWIADGVVRALNTNSAATSIAGKFFAELARLMRTLYDSLTGNQRTPPSIENWVNGLFDAEATRLGGTVAEGRRKMLQRAADFLHRAEQGLPPDMETEAGAVYERTYSGVVDAWMDVVQFALTPEQRDTLRRIVFRDDIDKRLRDAFAGNNASPYLKAALDDPRMQLETRIAALFALSTGPDGFRLEAGPNTNNVLAKLQGGMAEWLGYASDADYAETILDAVSDGSLKMIAESNRAAFEKAYTERMVRRKRKLPREGDPKAVRLTFDHKAPTLAKLSPAKRKMTERMERVSAMFEKARTVYKRTVAESVYERAETSGIPSVAELASRLFTPGDVGGSDRGMVRATEHKIALEQQKVIRTAGALSNADQKTMLDLLQRAVKDDDLPDTPAGKAARAIRQQLREFHAYQKDAGVKLGFQENFFPVVPDVDGERTETVEYLAFAGPDKAGQPTYKKTTAKVTPKQAKLFAVLNQPKFEAAMREFKDVLVAQRRDARIARLEDLIAREKDADAKQKLEEQLKDEQDKSEVTLESTSGMALDFVESAIRDPEFAATFDNAPRARGANRRSMDFIYKLGTPEEIATFAEVQSKDLSSVLSAYIEPMVRKAEYTRRLGNGRYERMLARIEAEGGTAEDVAFARDMTAAALGTYGADGSPVIGMVSKGLAQKLHGRKTQGAISNVMAYQNWRLLPLALLSSLSDPILIGLRAGGDMGTTFDAIRRGLSAQFNKESKAEMEQMIAQLGAAADFGAEANLQYALGGLDQTAFSRRSNDILFRWNGMSWLAKATRHMALHAAHGFLSRHALRPNDHSERYFRELGLQPGDVQVETVISAEGKPVSRVKLDTGDAARDYRVRSALLNFVDDAVLRPNALQSPLWHADPYMGAVTQYKSFLFAMWDQFGRRIGAEVNNGNMIGILPAIIAYAPLAVMAMLMREEIQYGGEGNPNRANWTAVDYTQAALTNSGMLGPGATFLGSVQSDLNEARVPVLSQLGPTFTQASNVGETLVGERNAGETLQEAVPTSVIWEKRFGTEPARQGQQEPVNLDQNPEEQAAEV